MQPPPPQVKTAPAFTSQATPDLAKYQVAAATALSTLAAGLGMRGIFTHVIPYVKNMKNI